MERIMPFIEQFALGMGLPIGTGIFAIFAVQSVQRHTEMAIRLFAGPCEPNSPKPGNRS